METRKLYYEDSHCRQFTARVLSCEETEKGFAVILDATAFYPEGGGQDGDTGTLGAVRVLDTREQDGAVVHYCDGPLTEGETVEGVLDWDARFIRMQQHSGEHIVSGLIHKKYGYHNVGFHMSSDVITIDFDGIIPKADLPELERLANQAVWSDLPVKCWYPSEEELPNVFYRTKRQLPWPVRIVEFPGYDSCACCGTHVKRTGEIGLVKLFSAVKFRNGTRMEMACGKIALEMLNGAWEQNKLVSQAFSAKITETGAAAQTMNVRYENLKFRIFSLESQLFDAISQIYAGQKQALYFDDGLEDETVRKLADTIADKVEKTGFAAVFSGEDTTGYKYCLASRKGDLRQLGKDMIKALNGRGGGKQQLQMGRVSAEREEIEAFFKLCTCLPE